jgi:hypothetical protein
MDRMSFAVFLAASTAASVAQAVPFLSVSDSYANNVWVPPVACLADTSTVPTPACLPWITTLTGPPAGFRLSRQNSVPGANGFTSATSFDNGVLTAGAEGVGMRDLTARSQFVETYTYVGPASTPLLVPFKIDRFRLGTNSLAPLDLQTAQMTITIDITASSILTNVATLNWQAQSDSVAAATFTPAPTPVAGVTLAPGFLLFAGVTTPNTTTSVTGPGGIMMVDLGTFAVGQTFTLDYRMACQAFGSGAGSSFCIVGDPFSIPSGPGFNLMGLATPVPEPATWALFAVGLGVCGTALRKHRATLPRAT